MKALVEMCLSVYGKLWKRERKIDVSIFALQFPCVLASGYQKKDISTVFVYGTSTEYYNRGSLSTEREESLWAIANRCEKRARVVR